MKTESLKQMKPSDSELFRQFLDRLLDRRIDLKDIVDKVRLSQ